MSPRPAPSTARAESRVSDGWCGARVTSADRATVGREGLGHSPTQRAGRHGPVDDDPLYPTGPPRVVGGTTRRGRAFERAALPGRGAPLLARRPSATAPIMTSPDVHTSRRARRRRLAHALGARRPRRVDLPRRVLAIINVLLKTSKSKRSHTLCTGAPLRRRPGDMCGRRLLCRGTGAKARTEPRTPPQVNRYARARTTSHQLPVDRRQQPRQERARSRGPACSGGVIHRRLRRPPTLLECDRPDQNHIPRGTGHSATEERVFG